LAFANLTQEQIKRYFLHHEAYIKSLKSIQLPMYLMNFDQVRIETWGTGETTSRTTREWAQSLLSSDNVRCDTVNGGYDEKPYILVQAEQLAFVQNALRSYKLRLNPLGHREARFRDSLPGLPNVILIDSSTQQTLDFLEGLSSSDIWQSAPDSVRQPATDIPQQTNTQNSQCQQTPRTSPHHTGPKLPPPPRPTPPQKSSLRARSTYGTNNNSDDQTASTHSAMTPSQSGTARIHDLESQLKQLHSAIKLDSTATNSRLSEIDTQLSKSMDCHQTTVHSITDLRIQIQQLTGIITNMADRFDNFPPLSSRPNSSPLEEYSTREEAPRAETFMDTSGTGDTSPTAAATTQTSNLTPHNSSMSVQSRSSHSTGTGSSSSSLPPPPQQKKPRTLHSNMEQLSLVSGNTTTTEAPSTPHITDMATMLPTLLTTSTTDTPTAPPSPPHSPDTPTSPMGSIDSFDDIEDDILYPPAALPDLDQQYNLTPAPDGGAKG
jgi:hypothetical protein